MHHGHEAAVGELSVENTVAERLQRGVKQGSGVQMWRIVQIVCRFWVLQEERRVERDVVEHDVGHKSHAQRAAARLDDGP